MLARAHSQYLVRVYSKLTWKHCDDTDSLLAKEIADLYELSVVLNIGIDGEVSINQPHLVLEAISDPLEEVLQ